MNMTLVQFLDKFSFAPFSDNEVAYHALDVTDAAPLSTAAQRFLDAKLDFQKELNKVGFQYG